MQLRPLGRTGVQVSAACLGTMTFGWEPDDWGSHEKESLEVAAKAIDLGINFFDTADVYARGLSETIVGKALKGKREHIVLATKCHFSMSDDDPNMRGNSRRNIIAACEASLRRLQTEWIDLYQIHRPEPSVPIDETIRALDDIIRAGKVRYAGCSTYAAWQCCEAHYVAKQLGAHGFVSEQPPYNLLDRRAERELLPFCRTYEWAVIPWSPLAGGILSGKYLDPANAAGRYSKSDPQDRVNARTLDRVRKLKTIADRNQMTLATLSLAWVASQPGVTSPIIGARSLKQLEESAAACQITLSPKVLKQIDAVVTPGSHFIDYYRVSSGPNARPW